MLDFPDLLRLIDDRSAAFRAAIMSAPGLDTPVPTCPEWTLLELAQHLGQGQRRWGATVAAGPADDYPAGTTSRDASAAPQEREPLLAWSAESTRRLLDALREAGPDRGCHTWWERSESPQTSGAVARRQLQEVAVHTYDAQAAVGTPRPLPDDTALDGVGEFLSTSAAWTGTWPHKPAALDFRTTEGPSWRLSLSPGGGRTTRDATGPADAAVLGTASDVVLMLYDRVPLDALRLDGDRRVFDQLRAWDPDA